MAARAMVRGGANPSDGKTERFARTDFTSVRGTRRSSHRGDREGIFILDLQIYRVHTSICVEHGSSCYNTVHHNHKHNLRCYLLNKINIYIQSTHKIMAVSTRYVIITSCRVDLDQ